VAAGVTGLLEKGEVAVALEKMRAAEAGDTGADDRQAIHF
jgi:hypothetical protein